MKIPDYYWIRHWRPAVLVVAALLVHGRSVTFGFVNWDDPTYLQGNAAIQSFSLANLWQILTPGGLAAERLYIPVTYLSHLLESTLFGFGPGVIHTGNVLLHLANTLLVYGLFLALFRATTAPSSKPLSAACAPAMLGALLFALHPLQVESVAWAMGRKELLSTLFGLVCLLGWLRWFQEGRRAALVIASIAALLAMLAKPTMLILPGLLLLMSFAFPPHRPGRRHWLALGPAALASLVVLLVNRVVDASAQAEAAAAPLALLQAAYGPAILNGWLARLLLLQAPSPHYPLEALNPAGINVIQVLPLLLLLGLAGLAIRHRQHRLWFALGFSAIAMLPAASILLLRNRYFLTADRYGYFPLIGLWFLAAAGIALLHGRSRRLASALLGAFILLAAIQSFRYTGAWADSASLWRHALGQYPINPIAHNSLGTALADGGDVATAANHFRRAAGLQPDYARPRFNLALLIKAEAPARAHQLLRHAVLAEPSFAPAWQQLAAMRRQAGDPQGAMEAYNQALRIDPGHVASWYDRSLLYQDLGNLPAAIGDMQRVVALEPASAAGHFKLAVYFHHQGEAMSALQHYRQVVHLNPMHHLAWYNQAILLQALQEPAAALAAYRRALAIQPDDLDYQQAVSNLTTTP